MAVFCDWTFDAKVQSGKGGGWRGSCWGNVRGNHASRLRSPDDLIHAHTLWFLIQHTAVTAPSSMQSNSFVSFAH
ncbi:hypothetical protein SLA2020_137010 [Shorea laevis]